KPAAVSRAACGTAVAYVARVAVAEQQMAKRIGLASDPPAVQPLASSVSSGRQDPYAHVTAFWSNEDRGCAIALGSRRALHLAGAALARNVENGYGGADSDREDQWARAGEDRRGRESWLAGWARSPRWSGATAGGAPPRQAGAGDGPLRPG